MKFSRNLVVLFSSALFITACGGGTDKNATSKDSTASTASSTSNPADDKAISLIAGSDCTTCHRLHQSQPSPTTGPAYDQVAAKYKNAADTTVNRLVNKVVTGGSGIWGTIPMTPHPNLSKDDIKTIVTYILTLKQQ